MPEVMGQANAATRRAMRSWSSSLLRQAARRDAFVARDRRLTFAEPEPPDVIAEA